MHHSMTLDELKQLAASYLSSLDTSGLTPTQYYKKYQEILDEIRKAHAAHKSDETSHLN